MTNLTNALASRIANEDEVHFVHARNRVLLAIRLVEGAEVRAHILCTTVAAVLANETEVARIAHDDAIATGRRFRMPSADTVALAAEIAA
jgi:hypothetical protein